MWEFILRAPNGLQSKIILDELSVRHAASPVGYIQETLRLPLVELFDRRDEKNPNEEMTEDPRTGRPLGDHGTAVQAIDFALEHCNEWGPGEGEDFLRHWREGSLDEWPEFYEWLKEQE